MAQEGFASQRLERHRSIPLLCRYLAVALPQLPGTSGIARWLPDLRDTARGRTRPAGTYAPAGIYRDIGDRRGEILALNDSGTLSRIRGDLGQARSYHQQALELARQFGNAPGEAHALADLALCARAEGRTADAETGLRQTLALFQQIGAAEAADMPAELDVLPSVSGPTPATP